MKRLSLLLLASSTLWAAGLQRPNVGGARAIGMGGAYTAVADDPSAVWFNPAGTAFYGDNVVLTHVLERLVEGLGEPFIGNDYVADIIRHFPDVSIGFAGADPWQGQAAVRERQRAVKDLGLKGLKLVPPTQAFFPNDRRFYPL